MKEEKERIIIFLPKMVFAILCQLFVDYGPFNGAS